MNEVKPWITLDAFGTLFDFKGAFLEAATKIIDREHLSLDPLVFCQKWKELSEIQKRDQEPFVKLSKWLELSLKETFAHFGHQGRSEKGVNLLLSSLQKVPLYLDALPFLEPVRKKYKICLLTNIDNQELQKVLALHQLRFDAIISSEMIEAYKPDPIIFKRALEFIGKAPDQVVHIGDSPYQDVYGAKKIGMRAVWLNRNGEVFPQNLGVAPDLIFDTLKPVADFLLRH